MNNPIATITMLRGEKLLYPDGKVEEFLGEQIVAVPSPKYIPHCFGSNPSAQAQAENDCETCQHVTPCHSAAPLHYRKDFEMKYGSYTKAEAVAALSAHENAMFIRRVNECVKYMREWTKVRTPLRWSRMSDYHRHMVILGYIYQRKIEKGMSLRCTITDGGRR